VHRTTFTTFPLSDLSFPRRVATPARRACLCARRVETDARVKPDLREKLSVPVFYFVYLWNITYSNMHALYTRISLSTPITPLQQLLSLRILRKILNLQAYLSLTILYRLEFYFFILTLSLTCRMSLPRSTDISFHNRENWQILILCCSNSCIGLGILIKFKGRQSDVGKKYRVIVFIDWPITQIHRKQ